MTIVADNTFIIKEKMNVLGERFFTRTFLIVFIFSNLNATPFYFSPVYILQMPRVKALWVTARKPASRIVAMNSFLPGKAATEAGR